MRPNITPLDIRNGLANDEFLFYYQPIVSLVTGHIYNAEALLRWQRPDGTLLSPESFIPLAEERGFITEITQAMYVRLVDDLALISQKDDAVMVTLNLTTADFELENLAAEIGAALAEKRVNPRQFGIEIVESVFMPPNTAVNRAISAFAEQGIPIVLNDFSAGNTTLNYLSRLPLSALKLSMDIVQRAPMSKMDFRIFRHLVGMGHQLHLDVIAEGVENQELYDLILSTGCTAAQGYYFSKPLPLVEFIELLERRPRWGEYPFGLEYLAQIDHIDFRRDVIREALMIYTIADEAIRQRAMARLPQLEHTQCLLGKWYFGVGQEYRGTPGFERLGEVHQQFHEIARELLQVAEKGNPWDDLERLITQLTDQSSEMMLTLQSLAKGRLLAQYKPAQPSP